MAKKKRLKRIGTPIGQRLEGLLRLPITLLFWSAAGLSAWMIHEDRPVTQEFIGIARSPEVEVASAIDGRIETLPIALYQFVETGEVIATLDPSQIQSGIATARAELKQLRSELGAERARLENTERTNGFDRAMELRRYLGDESEARIDGLEVQGSIASNIIQEQRLRVRLERLQGLAAQGLTPTADIEELELRIERAVVEIASDRELHASTLEELNNARQRTEFYRGSLPGAPQHDPILEPLDLALDVQEAAIDELLIAARELVVRAPVDGHVASLSGHRGRVVQAGDPFLTLIPSGVLEIEVFIPEGELGALMLDDTVLLTSALNPTLTAQSTVIRLAPDVRALPQRLWIDPSIPVFGRIALVRGAPALGLSPGERVLVRRPDAETEGS
jgi:multidrug resistance efflux pump